MSNPIFCHSCGFKMLAHSNFCSKCGTSLASLTEQPKPFNNYQPPTRPPLNYPLPVSANAEDNEDYSRYDHVDHLDPRIIDNIQMGGGFVEEIRKGGRRGESLGSLINDPLDPKNIPSLQRNHNGPDLSKEQILERLRKEGGAMRSKTQEIN
jgi:hypothetical protein